MPKGKFKVGDRVQLASREILSKRGWKRDDNGNLQLNSLIINDYMLQRSKHVTIRKVLIDNPRYQYMMVENGWCYHDSMLKNLLLKKCKKCLKR
jgi:hypothetical protein